MCGLVGFIGGVNGGEALSQGAGQAVLRRMSDALIHRGPDDDGVWTLSSVLALGIDACLFLIFPRQVISRWCQLVVCDTNGEKGYDK